MKKLAFVIAALFFILYFPLSVKAFEYALPYPSYMPGHKLYTPRVLWEKVQEYWHFGDIAKFKYHREMSDRYLVEAKTLFEYEQYKLATASLEKSDEYFTRAMLYANDIDKSEKDNGEKRALLIQASKRHKEVLGVLLEELPKKVTWQEERKEEEKIPIEYLLRKSSTLRNYASN